MAVKESTTHKVLPQVVRGADLDRRAVLYSRVSTLNHGQDPELQSLEIREYCQRRGWPLVGEYVDVGISGAKERRPQPDRLIADAHRRKFEVVLV
jgi:DNA invertase Pin-like site-specific DNA recombinase